MTINLEPTLRPYLQHLEQLERRNAELEERVGCLEANRAEANSPIRDANWAADYLGISRATLNNWLAQRKILDDPLRRPAALHAAAARRVDRQARRARRAGCR